MLEVRSLGKRFGGITALDDVTLTFPAGKVTGLVGPNGAGKTTLFNAITGLLRPSAGAVLMDGRDVTFSPPQRMARLGIGRSFQHTRIAQKLTVLQNVLLANPAVNDRVLPMMLLSRARLKELHAEARSHLELVGLGQVAERRTDQLGFGEQRVAMIAALIASGARTLLLDEPTGGIDPAARGRILDLVLKLRDLGRTVVLIEHNLDVIRGTSDDVVFLAQGRVMARGTAAEIEADPALASLYFGASVHA